MKKIIFTLIMLIGVTSSADIYMMFGGSKINTKTDVSIDLFSDSQNIYSDKSNGEELYGSLGYSGNEGMMGLYYSLLNYKNKSIKRTYSCGAMIRANIRTFTDGITYPNITPFIQVNVGYTEITTNDMYIRNIYGVEVNPSIGLSILATNNIQFDIGVGYKYKIFNNKIVMYNDSEFNQRDIDFSADLVLKF